MVDSMYLPLESYTRSRLALGCDVAAVVPLSISYTFNEDGVILDNREVAEAVLFECETRRSLFPVENVRCWP